MQTRVKDQLLEVNMNSFEISLIFSPNVRVGSHPKGVDVPRLVGLHSDTIILTKI